MAAVLGRTQVQLRRTGATTTVPNSPTAKLMYYFNCVCSCVEPDSDASIRRLRNYENYSSLSDEEEATLVVLCLALSPDKLIGSVFFPAGDSDLDSGNEFFEVSAVSTRLVVAESILVGGQQRRVRKIMMFKKSWIENNYIQPMLSLTGGSRRALPSPRRPSPPPQPRRSRERDGSCTIL